MPEEILSEVVTECPYVKTSKYRRAFPGCPWSPASVLPRSEIRSPQWERRRRRRCAPCRAAQVQFSIDPLRAQTARALRRDRLRAHRRAAVPSNSSVAPRGGPSRRWHRRDAGRTRTDVRPAWDEHVFAADEGTPAVDPLASSSPDAGTNTNALASNTLSLVGGIALCCADIIGSGIFASPGIVLHWSGSVGASLLLWLLAGVITFVGSRALPNSQSWTRMRAACFTTFAPRSGARCVQLDVHQLHRRRPRKPRRPLLDVCALRRECRAELERRRL